MTNKPKKFEQPDLKRYIEALFIENRHGNTFADEAQGMINELMQRDFPAFKVFADIDSNPQTPFEKSLRLTATRLKGEKK